MRPSETSAGRRWLTNFHPTDQAVASVLLDSLRVLSLRDLQAKLRETMTTLVSDGALGRPALVVPERNLTAFPELADSSPGPRRPCDRDQKGPVAWRDFHPGGPVRLPAGSDAFVGMVLGDFVPRRGGHGARDGRWLSPEADLDMLRAQRCRTIVILTDYVASGEQSETLAQAITRNPTVRSWRSLGLIRIHVVAVAGQQLGIERLRSSRSVDAVHLVETAPSIETTFLDENTRDAVLTLCRSYSRQGRHALGFGGSGGLLITERRAPNNLPGIFIQSPSGWQALFADRQVPQEFADQASGYRPSESLADSAARVGQLRLGRNQRIRAFRRESIGLLQALVLASDRSVTEVELAEIMGLDIEEARANIAALQGWGFVDAAGQITEDGRTELQASKRGLRRTTAQLHGSIDPYYPVSVR